MPTDAPTARPAPRTADTTIEKILPTLACLRSRYCRVPYPASQPWQDHRNHHRHPDRITAEHPDVPTHARCRVVDRPRNAVQLELRTRSHKRETTQIGYRAGRAALDQDPAHAGLGEP